MDDHRTPAPAPDAGRRLIASESPATPRERRAAVAALATATLFWGATFFLMKSATAAIEARLAPGTGGWAALLFLALRFTLAALVFPLVFPSLLRSGRAGVGWGIAVGAPFAGGFILQVYGLREIEPTVSALYTSMFVIFTPLLVFALRRRAPTRPQLLGIGFAFAGLWFITGAGGLRGFGRGDLLSLLCAVSFAVQIYLTDIATKKADPTAVAWHSISFSALACAAPLLLVRPSPIAAAPACLASTPVLTGVLFTALLATVASMALMYRFQKRLSPSRAAVIYALEPVFAALFSWVFVHEGFGERKLLGGAMILAANVVCGLSEERETPPATASAPGSSA